VVDVRARHRERLSRDSAANVTQIEDGIAKRHDVIRDSIPQRLYSFLAPIASIDAAMPTKVSKRSIDSMDKKVASFPSLVVVFDCKIIDACAYFFSGVWMKLDEIPEKSIMCKV
jgi:hypothetical protein